VLRQAGRCRRSRADPTGKRARLTDASAELLAAEQQLAELHERRAKILDELEAAERRHLALEQPAKPELQPWRKGESRAEEHAAFEKYSADCRACRAEQARLRQVSGVEDA